MTLQQEYKFLLYMPVLRHCNIVIKIINSILISPNSDLIIAIRSLWPLGEPLSYSPPHTYYSTGILKASYKYY